VNRSHSSSSSSNSNSETAAAAIQTAATSKSNEHRATGNNEGNNKSRQRQHPQSNQIQRCKLQFAYECMRTRRATSPQTAAQITKASQIVVKCYKIERNNSGAHLQNISLSGQDRVQVNKST